MKKTALFATVMLVLWAGFCRAEWIDDWIQQKTTTSADYFEGQKRGFATFGGFSARWNMGNDYLVTVTPPSFRAGCGGIDVFLGGFSFLNADYLVQKLQNMLSAAPAVAFDMALSTLCEQCSKTVKSLEAASSRLNQLQFDDCKATRAGVSVLMNDDFSKVWADAKRKSEQVIDYVQSKGLQDMWEDVQKLWNSTGDKTLEGVAKASGASGTGEMVSDCPTIINNVFFHTDSMLYNVGTLMLGYSADYVDLMRGYVGDVVVSNLNGGYQYQLIDPCPDNKPEKIEALVEGDVYKRVPATAATCTKITSLTINGSTYHSVRDWVFSTLNDICTRMAGANPLTTDDQDFLKPVPMPLYRAIFADIEAQGPSVNCASIADMYSDSVAAAYAYAMITDLYDLINRAIMKANTIAANTQGAKTASDKDNCKTLLAADGLRKIQTLMGRLRPYMRAAREQYLAKLNGLLSHKEYAASVSQFNQVVRESLANVFSKALSNRVVGP